MQCKICGQENPSCFSERILGRYQVEYYRCNNCCFVQTQEPFWLEEAYARPVNLSDTGYMVRNLFYSKRLTILLFLLFGSTGKFLDYAGGYGVFVRLMRDIGFDFYWEDKYSQNLFSAGFERDYVSKIDAVTVFEAFEHFENPMMELESLLKISKTIIFSTELYPEPLPEPKDWWYYGLDHGQHIAFYSEKTIGYMAERFDVNYYRLGSLHIFSDREIPKWKILAMRLSRFGLYPLIAKKLKSKTWDDHQKATKMVIK